MPFPACPDVSGSIPIYRNLSGLETVPTQHGARKYLFIFRIHYKYIEDCTGFVIDKGDP